MECPTWVWDNICSTHYWPQRTKQVEQQSQGKRQWINDGLVLFTTSQMSSFIATIWTILFINTFSINLEIASCSPRMITVFWRSFNLSSWGVHYSVFVVKGKLRVTLNYEEYEDKPTHNPLQFFITHLFSRLKEQLVFGDKHVSNVNIDFFLSFFYELQFYYRC